VHYDVASWHAMPSLFTLALAMGLAYERTRAPLVPITMHALFNASMIALAVASERNHA
jgi:membrane protease YdiL (CAAX protease family)